MNDTQIFQALYKVGYIQPIALRTVTTEPLWTLDQGREMVIGVQGLSREYGYHVALGGGVLNTGESRKDLDLYFLPLDSDKIPVRWADLLRMLQGVWGPSETLIDPRYEVAQSEYRYKQKFSVYGKRIDVFII